MVSRIPVPDQLMKAKMIRSLSAAEESRINGKMKGCFTFTKSPKVEPYYQMQLMSWD